MSATRPPDIHSRRSRRRPDPWQEEAAPRTSGRVARGRSGGPRRLAFLGLWLVIVVLIAGGYAYRRELTALSERVQAQQGLSKTGYRVGRALAFEAAADGHFYVRATVNGVALDFLVDTGATHVVLSPADARRLGLALTEADFIGRAATANGMVRSAPVILDSVSLGPVSASGVRASVNGAPLAESLLGMSFLNQTGGFEIRDGRLIVYPKA